MHTISTEVSVPLDTDLERLRDELGNNAVIAITEARAQSMRIVIEMSSANPNDFGLISNTIAFQHYLDSRENFRRKVG